MGIIRLHDNINNDATFVPNAFIDHHMTDANGEYVKIFLYLLRLVNQPQADFSLSTIADHFEHTQKDILRAFRYWEKHGLLRLEYKDEVLSGILICQDALRETPAACSPSTDQHTAPAVNIAPQQAPTTTMPVANDIPTANTQPSVTSAMIQAVAPQKKSYSPAEIARLAEESDIQEILYIAEQYLGRSLNQTDLDRVFGWYDQLKLSADLIEYLIEHCVSNGHSSLYYMQRIAEELASLGFCDKSSAQAHLQRSSETYHTVMKHFGIHGRHLTEAELHHMHRWSNTWGFDDVMIAEACRRTIENTHEPSFAYADSILSNWQKQKIFDMESLAKADEQFNRTRSEKPASKTSAPIPFTNFKQRNTDYEELQKQLIQSSRSS